MKDNQKLMLLESIEAAELLEHRCFGLFFDATDTEIFLPEYLTPIVKLYDVSHRKVEYKDRRSPMTSSNTSPSTSPYTGDLFVVVRKKNSKSLVFFAY